MLYLQCVYTNAFNFGRLYLYTAPINVLTWHILSLRDPVASDIFNKQLRVAQCGNI